MTSPNLARYYCTPDLLVLCQKITFFLLHTRSIHQVQIAKGHTLVRRYYIHGAMDGEVLEIGIAEEDSEII
jgi:hypothetical protein